MGTDWEDVTTNIAQRLAEGDSAPITEEWLEATDFGDIVINGDGASIIVDSGVVGIAVDDSDCAAVVLLPTVKTRGQFIRLAAVLKGE